MNTNEIDVVKTLRDTDFHQDCDYCEHSDLCKDKDCVILQAADTIERLQKELEAAKADIKQCFKVGECEDGEPIYDIGICQFCKKSKSDDLCDCGRGVGQGGFEWRGRESEVSE